MPRQPPPARWARAAEIRLVGLAVLHAALLYGLFQRDERAAAVARYLALWPLAEAATLIVIPGFMILTAEDRQTPRWLRAGVLIGALLATGGVGMAVRLLRATWFYLLTGVPVLFARHTRADVQRGCARSWINLLVLFGLLAVFADRATVWPIGTVAGRWMAPETRETANLMACAVGYFGLAAVVERLMRRYGGAAVPEA
jgi:hypothetical protein